MTTSEEGEFGGGAPDDADVVVIGGGIAGSSVAYHLAEAGIESALLERDRIGGGATAAAVGVLSPPMRQPFHETVHDRGADVAREIWEFARRSVQGLGEAIGRHGGECELDLSGGWVLSESHSSHEVKASYEALKKEGLDVEWVEPEAVREIVGGRGFRGGIRVAGGGGLHPGEAARALARAASANGCRVVEGCSVTRVERDRGGALSCELQGGATVRARMVVYATHVDSGRFSALLGDEIVPIRGQALSLEVPEPFHARGAFATHWKLNVFRRSAESEHVVYLGGWRHDAWDRAYWKARPRIDEKLQADLLRWFEGTFPELGSPRVVDRWSGIFGWTADYLPLVGPLPGTTDEIVVGGFSGGGLPFAFECGRLVAHLVAGKEPVPGAPLLNPRRFV